VGLALFATSLTAVAADSLDFSVDVGAPVNTPEAVVDPALTQLCPSVTGEAGLATVCGYLKGVTPPPPDQKAQVDEVLREISAKVNTSPTILVSRVFSFIFGVLNPQFGATWLHELSSEGEQLKAQFSADANATQFGFVTQNQDSDYYIVNADVQILAPGGRVGFVRLSNVRLLRDRSETGITAGYRMGF